VITIKWSEQLILNCGVWLVKLKEIVMSRLTNSYSKEMSDRQMAIKYKLKSYAGTPCHCGSVEKLTESGTCKKCNRGSK